jgi:hypothetical protein
MAEIMAKFSYIHDLYPSLKILPHRHLVFKGFVSCWEYRVSASAATEKKNMYSKQKYFSKKATSAETLAQWRQCMDAHLEIKDNSSGPLTSTQLTF